MCTMRTHASTVGTRMQQTQLRIPTAPCNGQARGKCDRSQAHVGCTAAAVSGAWPARLQRGRVRHRALAKPGARGACGGPITADRPRSHPGQHRLRQGGTSCAVAPSPRSSQEGAAPPPHPSACARALTLGVCVRYCCRGSVGGPGAGCGSVRAAACEVPSRRDTGCDCLRSCHAWGTRGDIAHRPAVLPALVRTEGMSLRLGADGKGGGREHDKRQPATACARVAGSRPPRCTTHRTGDRGPRRLWPAPRWP